MNIQHYGMGSFYVVSSGFNIFMSECISIIKTLYLRQINLNQINLVPWQYEYKSENEYSKIAIATGVRTRVPSGARYSNHRTTSDSSTHIEIARG